MRTIAIRNAFSDDYITREAGERLRKMLVKELKTSGTVVVDFSNITIASTAFLDEGVAKLNVEGFSPNEIIERVTLKNMHPRDLEILNRLSADRWQGEKAEFWDTKPRDS